MLKVWRVETKSFQKFSVPIKVEIVNFTERVGVLFEDEDSNFQKF